MNLGWKDKKNKDGGLNNIIYKWKFKNIFQIKAALVL